MWWSREQLIRNTLYLSITYIIIFLLLLQNKNFNALKIQIRLALFCYVVAEILLGKFTDTYKIVENLVSPFVNPIVSERIENVRWIVTVGYSHHNPTASFGALD